MGGDREKKVRIVCECEICRAWEETQREAKEAQSERGADEDGGRPEWGGWSLIKMFFN